MVAQVMQAVKMGNINTKNISGKTMRSDLFKMLTVILFWICFVSCAKNATSNMTDDIAKPEIMYISYADSPVRKQTLILMDAVGDNRREIYTTNRSVLWDPIFTNDGKSIIFVMHVNTPDTGAALYKIDVDGKNLLRISENKNDETNTPYKNPQPLPDGNNIVYFKRLGLRDYAIRMINIATQEDKLLVSGFFSGVYPEITGDGEWIVFWEDSDLYKYHIMSGDKYKLTNGNAFAERFNLNKRTNDIVYRSYNPHVPGEMNISKINLDGSNYIKYDFSGQYPKLSHDGARLLFMAVADDKPSIWMANLDGSNVKVVLSHYTWDELVQFYPTGDRILFVRSETDQALFSYDINGNVLKQLTPFDYYPGNRAQFRPSLQ